MAEAPVDPFLAILRDVIIDRLGVEHALAGEAGAALAAPGTGAEARFRAALEALAAPERDAILAEVHRRMREDLAAIWEHLPGRRAGGAAERPN